MEQPRDRWLRVAGRNLPGRTALAFAGAFAGGALLVAGCSTTTASNASSDSSQVTSQGNLDNDKPGRFNASQVSFINDTANPLYLAKIDDLGQTDRARHLGNVPAWGQIEVTGYRRGDSQVELLLYSVAPGGAKGKQLLTATDTYTGTASSSLDVKWPKDAKTSYIKHVELPEFGSATFVAAGFKIEVERECDGCGNTGTFNTRNKLATRQSTVTISEAPADSAGDTAQAETVPRDPVG